MTLTSAAETRLLRLLQRASSGTTGLRFEGAIGSCHGSTPMLKPVAGPARKERTCVCGGVTFFVPAKYADMFEAAVLDYDDAFLGKGLSLICSSNKGCDCEGCTA